MHPSFYDSRQLPKYIAFAAIFSLVSSSCLFATDATVMEEPAEPALARFSGGEDGVTSVSWYYTSDIPHQERQLAQTIQVESDGTAKFFAVKLAQDHVKGLGDDATYQLSVYESATRPDRTFINRSPILKQEGVVRNGEGPWLVFPLDEAVELKGAHFYTFTFRFSTMSPGNRVIFTHSQGDSAKLYRWHRADRSSWVASPLSLHFLVY